MGKKTGNFSVIQMANYMKNKTACLTVSAVIFQWHSSHSATFSKAPILTITMGTFVLGLTDEFSGQECGF